MNLLIQPLKSIFFPRMQKQPQQSTFLQSIHLLLSESPESTAQLEKLLTSAPPPATPKTGPATQVPLVPVTTILDDKRAPRKVLSLPSQAQSPQDGQISQPLKATTTNPAPKRPLETKPAVKIPPTQPLASPQTKRIKTSGTALTGSKP